MTDMIAGGLMYAGPTYDISSTCDTPSGGTVFNGKHLVVNRSDATVYEFPPGFSAATATYDISSEESDPQTLNTDNDSLWMTGTGGAPNGRAYHYDESFSLIETLDTTPQGNGNAISAAKVDSVLWVGGAGTDIIYGYTESLDYTGESIDANSVLDVSGSTVVNKKIWIMDAGSGEVHELDVASGFTGRYFDPALPISARTDVWYDGSAFYIPDMSTGVIHTFIPDPPLIAPPTPEELFRASFADASGRDPLPTALLTREDARKLIGHTIRCYEYPPMISEVTIPCRPEHYADFYGGTMHWFKVADNPMFSMGRWAYVLGSGQRPKAKELDLIVFICDNPLCFVEPTE